MNLRELNYILIPRSSEQLERWMEGRLARVTAPIVGPFRALTVEGRVTAVAVLVTGAAGVDVHFSHLYLVFCGLFGLLAAAFLLRPLASLRGVRLDVEHPRRVAVGEPATFTLVVRNQGPRAAYAVRAFGPFLPWDGTWLAARPAAPVVEAGDEVRLTASASFLCRGDRLVGRFHVASVRPLGLVAGPRVWSERVRLLVVPRVFEVAGLLAPPSVRGRADARPSGRLAGESFELLGLRPYRPGDRVRDLHVRSWARLGEPVVREYRLARRRRLAVVLHAVTPERPREVLDAACALAASLVRWGVGRDALVDLLVAGEQPLVVEVGGEVAAFERALDALAEVTAAAAAPVTGGAVAGLAAQAGMTCLVFADWGPAQAAVLEAARRGGGPVHGFLVTARKDVGDARGAGVRVLGVEDLKGPSVYLG